MKHLLFSFVLLLASSCGQNDPESSLNLDHGGVGGSQATYETDTMGLFTWSTLSLKYLNGVSSDPPVEGAEVKVYNMAKQTMILQGVSDSRGYATFKFPATQPPEAGLYCASSIQEKLMLASYPNCITYPGYGNFAFTIRLLPY